MKNNGCCSLELAKELKELGFKQNTMFCWVKSKSGQWHLCRIVSGNPNCYDIKNMQIINQDNYEDIYAAPTVAELREALPIYITEDGTYSDIQSKGRKVIFKKLKFFLFTEHRNAHEDYRNIIFYATHHCQSHRCNVHAKTEADARAKMWICLVENKLFEVKDE